MLSLSETNSIAEKPAPTFSAMLSSLGINSIAEKLGRRASF
jgi:hypothetical protein